MSSRLIAIATFLLLLLPVSGRAQKPELVVQAGHSSFVNSVAFSPDGQMLVSGSYDKTVQLWDVPTGKELRAFIGHRGYVASVAFSRDGKTIASGSVDKTVKLWNVATGAELRTLKGHSGWVNCVVFSPDGKSLVSSSDDSTIKLWDVATGLELRTLKGHAGAVTSVAFSPDGHMIASGSEDKTIKLWDVGTGVALRTTAEQNEGVKSVAYSPDGKSLASGSWGFDCVKLWDVATGAKLRTIKMDSYSYVESVAFSLDGQTLAGVSANTIKLWNVATGAELSTLEGSGDRGNSIAFSPDRKILAGANGKDINLWRVATGVEVRTLKGRAETINAVVFSPDGKMLARATGANVKLWEITSGVELKLKGHVAGVSSVAFSRDGQMLASGSHDRTIKLWNTATGTEVRTLLGHTGRAVPAEIGGVTLADALAAGVTAVAFSPDGTLLASGSQRYVIKLWDVATGAEVRSLGSGNAQSQAGNVNSISFSPDGKTLASSSKEVLANVRLWDVATGRVRHTLKRHSDFVYFVVFSPDGTLATGSSESVTLWDVTAGVELRTLAADRVGSAAFSSDGKTLATGGNDNTIKLWDVATGAQIRTLNGHSNSVTSVRFNASNKYLVSGSDDASVKVWDVGSGQELASLIALDEQDWVVVTPDGLFDGSPAAWNTIIWRFNNNTFNYAPIEAFFSDFFYPGLLADIIAGKRPKARSDLSQKDRRQPQLKLTAADAQPDAKFTARNVTVKIEIAELAVDKGHKKGSGAQDVRLFRNGSLVKVWRGDVLKGKRSVTLEATIPIVAGENKLTAYAFNHDNIKSTDETLVVNGDDSLKRPATAYILAVGINRYSNRRYNLKYAVADAQDFSAEIKRQQEALKRYAQVEVISLADAQATKANIAQKLTELSARVQPEDAVIVFFAGHGTAHGNQFYLIPHDLGYRGSRENLSAAGLQTILKHSISDRELEKLFEGVDAGQLLLVIDACNSGQALEAEEKRRGPMNSKGLAQLAYEKGMYVLTASQSYQAALEAERFGHGFLTYALVEEGLKKGSADHEPKNGTIDIREWLNFATDEVPRIQEQSSLDALRGRSRYVVFVGDGREVGIPKTETGARDNIQRPRVFYRRDLEANPLVVATVAGGSPK